MRLLLLGSLYKSCLALTRTVLVIYSCGTAEEFHPIPILVVNL